MKLTESFPFFLMPVLIPYTAMFWYRMFMKNAGNDAIFFFYVFLQNEMYCIFCPDSGNISGFFSSGRDFFLFFKYVYHTVKVPVYDH